MEVLAQFEDALLLPKSYPIRILDKSKDSQDSLVSAWKKDRPEEKSGWNIEHNDGLLLVAFSLPRAGTYGVRNFKEAHSLEETKPEPNTLHPFVRPLRKFCEKAQRLDGELTMNAR